LEQESLKMLNQISSYYYERHPIFQRDSSTPPRQWRGVAQNDIVIMWIQAGS